MFFFRSSLRGARILSIVCVLNVVEAARINNIIATHGSETIGGNRSRATSTNPAVMVYAAGNCQFLPLFDVAHFLIDAAPTAAAGVGMLAKPAITAAAATATASTATTAAVGVVQMGTKAGLVGKLLGGAIGLTTPLGVALNVANVGMTAYQLYKLHQMLSNPAAFCSLLAAMPPVTHPNCAAMASAAVANVGDAVAQVAPLAEVGDAVQKALVPGNLFLEPKTALAAGAVLLAASGALTFWHHKVHSVHYDNALCPRGNYLENPLLAQFDFLEAAESSFGMQRCNGLRWVAVPTTCGDDLNCRHTTCQQACCDDKDCSMYQLDLTDPSKCWLGSAAASFAQQRCELWAGALKSGEQFHRHANLSFQVLGLQKLKIWKTSDNFERLCAKIGEENDECTYKVCEAACQSAGVDCNFFQVKSGKRDCWVGKNALETYPQDIWYGGIVDAKSSKTGCSEGTWLCPLTSECVDSCSTGCDGFGLSSADNRCHRTGEQGICHPGNWIDSYKGQLLNDTQCTGLTQLIVELTEETGFNGHTVCREVCCNDPDCILYQVRRKDGENQNLKAGSKVYCWLGKVDSSLNSLFKCDPNHHSLPFDQRQWVGGHISQRGCEPGQYACLLTGECVSSCSSMCPGAVNTDLDGRQCVSDTPALDTSISSDVISDAEVGAKPSYYLHSTNQGKAAETAEADTLLMIAQNKGRLVTSIKENPDICKSLEMGGRGCSAVDDGCDCRYKKPETCQTWFDSPNQLRVVISDQGMLFLPGDACNCPEEQSGTLCHFGILGSIPSIRLQAGDETSINIV